MSQTLDDAVLHALRPVLNPRCRTLNIPSGNCELSRWIEETGGLVTSSDLFPEFSNYKREEVVKADMNEPLPFDGGMFDAVVSQEGIEHIENLPRFLAECRRVLKDGGLLLLTTPNYMDLSSRFSFFLTGIKGFRGYLPNEQSTIWGMDQGRIYHGHAFTLPFFQIRYLLRINHFDDITLRGIKHSGVARCLYYLMRPFMGFCLRVFTSRRSRRDRRYGRPSVSPDLGDELRRLALSRALLTGKTILVVARHAEGSFVPDPALKISTAAEAPTSARRGGR